MRMDKTRNTCIHLTQNVHVFLLTRLSFTVCLGCMCNACSIIGSAYLHVRVTTHLKEAICKDKRIDCQVTELNTRQLTRNRSQLIPNCAYCLESVSIHNISNRVVSVHTVHRISTYISKSLRILYVLFS